MTRRIIKWLRTEAGSRLISAGLLFVGFIAILAFGTDQLILLNNLIPKRYPDTEDYLLVRKTIELQGFLATRTGFRGQLFPVMWLLSDTLEIPYPAFVGYFSLVVGLYVWFISRSFLNVYGRLLTLIFVCMYLTSKEHISWSTTLLTESIQFFVILFFWSNLFSLESALGQWNFRETSPSTRYAKDDQISTLSIKVMYFSPFLLLSIVFLHTLKPWLLILPVVYTGVRIALYLPTVIFKMGSRYAREKFARHVLFITLVVSVSILSAQTVYTSLYAKNLGSANIIAFLIRERADLYLGRILLQRNFPSERVELLKPIYSQLASGVPLCVGRDWACDLKWAGLNGDSPWSGNPGPLRLFREIYLSDVSGVCELAKISIKRILSNFMHAESLTTYYGQQSGHEILKLVCPYIGPSLVILTIVWITSLIQGLRSHSIVKIAHSGPCLAALSASIALMIFLTISGGYETGRTEAPGVYCALILGMALPGIQRMPTTIST